jgi:hypothetical protein
MVFTGEAGRAVQPYGHTDNVLRAQDDWVMVWVQVGQLAASLAKTNFVPKAMRGEPAQVAACIMTGRELGLGPMASLRGIDMIEGRPALQAATLDALARQAGHSVTYPDYSDTKVTALAVRGDDGSRYSATWTIADAQRAGLAGKAVWRQYPRAMLKARALSEVARMAFPEVALGLDADAADLVVAGTEAAAGSGAAVALAAAPTAAPAGLPAPLAAADAEARKPVAKARQAAHAPVEQAPAPQPEAAPVEQVGEQVGEPDDGLITPRQLRRLWALLRNIEGVPPARADRLAWLADKAGLPDGLPSANALTRDQATGLLSRLEGMVAQ